MDWMLLAHAIEFYKSLGYRYVDVPWIVPDATARMTFDGEGLACQAGTLIGSAEQGFLAIDIAPGDRLVSCSPCFRNEPVIDELHHLWFMKVELYIEGSHLDEVVDHALQFFKQHLDAYQVLCSHGWDIEAEGIELGSYGVRYVNDRIWTYGTGLALPRLTIAMEKSKVS